MRYVPVRKPSRLRAVLLGLTWLALGGAALSYLVTRPPADVAHHSP